MGKVPSYRIRPEAEDLALATTGVKGVTNKIDFED
jgi:osmotically-inducible protein OsmY